jgi:hypothetical protein
VSRNREPDSLTADHESREDSRRLDLARARRSTGVNALHRSRNRDTLVAIRRPVGRPLFPPLLPAEPLAMRGPRNRVSVRDPIVGGRRERPTANRDQVAHTVLARRGWRYRHTSASAYCHLSVDMCRRAICRISRYETQEVLLKEYSLSLTMCGRRPLRCNDAAPTHLTSWSVR